MIANSTDQQLVEQYWPKVEQFIADNQLDSQNPEHQAKIDVYIDELLAGHLEEFGEKLMADPEVQALVTEMEAGEQITAPVEATALPSMSEPAPAVTLPPMTAPSVEPQFVAETTPVTEVQPEAAQPVVSQPVVAAPSSGSLESLRAQILAHTPSYTAPASAAPAPETPAQ